MKQRWGLDRNVLRPTPGDPWGVEQPTETLEQKKPTVEPQWAKQRTKKLRPQPTKINSLSFPKYFENRKQTVLKQLYFPIFMDCFAKHMN